MADGADRPGSGTQDVKAGKPQPAPQDDAKQSSELCEVVLPSKGEQSSPEVLANTSNQRPTLVFSVAHALSMVRKRREEEDRATEEKDKALQEERREKAKEKRRRRRKNQKERRAKQKAEALEKTDKAEPHEASGHSESDVGSSNEACCEKGIANANNEIARAQNHVSRPTNSPRALKRKDDESNSMMRLPVKKRFRLRVSDSNEPPASANISVVAHSTVKSHGDTSNSQGGPERLSANNSLNSRISTALIPRALMLKMSKKR